MTEQPATAINTRSGNVLDFADPDPAAIVLEDVAGGLSLAPRFGGQALHFHSVAQHAVSVAKVVASMGHEDLRLPALHHDSHEAYACDLPKPLKRMLRDSYSAVTEELDRVIAVAFDFEWPAMGSVGQKAIKDADDAVFVIEARDLLGGDPPYPDVDPSLVRKAEGIVRTGEHWASKQAALEFKRVHEDGLRLI